MVLKEIYERFLSSPNPLNLAENASLHYITTLSSFSQSGPIVRHLEHQSRNVVRKKGEKVIGVVEGHDALVVEVETTLEFISGGGSYLPGLENFITDKIATFPITHTVLFDKERKIRLIRICWDQGSLLMQAEVIGARGKNWPICDGKDQARLISSNTVSSMAVQTFAPTTSLRGEADRSGGPGHSTSPNKKHIKDPHSSLNLFEERKENRREPQPAGIAPRTSAKPAPREMSDLFAAGHEDYEPSQSNDGSPRKLASNTVVAPKGAGGQNFQPSRLFDDEPDTQSPAPYKSNPAKYNHFDIGDEFEDDPLQYKSGKVAVAAMVPMRPKTTKHMSNWGFEDFVTPEKVQHKIRTQDVRHFGWGEDEGVMGETPGKRVAAPKPRRDADHHFEFKDSGTPIEKQPIVPRPRKDNETHFEFKDDGTPAHKRPTGPAKVSLRGNTSQGLYENHLYDDGTAASEFEAERPMSKGTAHASTGQGLYDHHLYDDGTAASKFEEKRPLHTVSNNAARKSNFDAKWDNADVTPPDNVVNKENKHLAANKGMSSQWSSSESPEKPKKPLGGNVRKGLESHWGFDQDADEGVPAVTKPGKRVQAHSSSIWDF